MGKKTILIAAALCCLFLYCDNPTDKKTLDWYSTFDIPINLQLKVWSDVENIPDLGLDARDSVVVDMSSSSFTIYDEIYLVRKMRNPESEYTISMSNRYKNVGFVFYALIAHKDEDGEDIGIEDMDIREVYDLITNGGSADSYKCVSIFDPQGFRVRAGADTAFERKFTDSAAVSAQLCSLVLNSPSIAWRWLAKISRRDFMGLKDTGNDTTEIIDVRFRLRVRGISNLDSIMTF